MQNKTKNNKKSHSTKRDTAEQARSQDLKKGGGLF